MAYKTTKLSKKESQSWVDKAISGWQSSWNYRESSWHNKWQDWQRLYDSERVLVGYKGISDTFVPMSYSTVEALVAATAGDKPSVEYFPTRYDQKEETEVLNSLFSYYWDLDSWTLKTVNHSRNLFKLGTSIMFGYWNIDHPCLENISNRDFFCDPNATIFNYQNAAYMGHRYLTSLQSLKSEMVVDPETEELVPKFMNLDKVEGGRDAGEGDETAKEELDTHMGSELDKDAKKDQVEIIVYCTLDDIVYVANRREVIYHQTNFFKQRQQFLGYENPTGMYPYIIDAFNPNEAQLYGMSILQPIMKPQELLNDMTNQNVDAASWSLDPEMELDPMYEDHIEKIQSATGNIYPFKPGSYSAVVKQPIPSAVFNERMNIKNEIRESTAIDEIVKGIRAQGDTTATEIKAQVAQSSRRFDLIVGMLESGGYYKMAKLVFQLIQHYVTAPVMFRVVGQSGTDWQKFDPEQFNGDYEPRVKLKATLDNERQMKMRDAKEAFNALVGNPYVKEDKLTKYFMRRAFNMDADEVNELVKSEEDLMRESSGKNKDDEIAKKAIKYGEAPPDIRAQMEEQAGYNPSSTHEGGMELQALNEELQKQQGIEEMQSAVTFEEPSVAAPDGAMQRGNESADRFMNG